MYYSGKKHRRSLSRKSKSNFFRSNRFGSRFGSRRNSSHATSNENSSASQVLPAITVGASNFAEKKKPNLPKPGFLQIPAPGKSIDVGPGTRNNHLSQPDDDRYKELEEKLRHLAEASRTSHETFIPDEGSPSKIAAPANVVSTSVQTSLTDLTGLGRRPGKFDLILLNFNEFKASFTVNHKARIMLPQWLSYAFSSFFIFYVVS